MAPRNRVVWELAPSQSTDEILRKLCKTMDWLRELPVGGPLSRRMIEEEAKADG